MLKWVSKRHGTAIIVLTFNPIHYKEMLHVFPYNPVDSGRLFINLEWVPGREERRA